MKNRIGIVTVYGENNYGNKLQNYACVKIYEKLNCSVSTIKRIQSSMNPTLKNRIKNNIKKFLGILSINKKYKYLVIREKNFKLFSKKFLKLDCDYSNTHLEKFDYLSVGSDQVWNDEDFDINDLRYFLLNDISKPIKIALSPSIGKNKIKCQNEKILVESLSKFKALSCREIIGCEYINKLTKRDCIHLIDPTMTISNKDWEKIEKKPKWLKKEKYVFSYFLGGMPEKIKSKYNTSDIKLIDIMDKKKIYYTTSPEEFIYLIHHAEIVLTDSFHASVFSILFDKKFVVSQRRVQNCNMTSRIETLFNLFDQNLKYNEVNDSSKWLLKNEIIDRETKKFYDYITMNL